MPCMKNINNNSLLLVCQSLYTQQKLENLLSSCFRCKSLLSRSQRSSFHETSLEMNVSYIINNKVRPFNSLSRHQHRKKHPRTTHFTSELVLRQLRIFMLILRARVCQLLSTTDSRTIILSPTD